MILWRFQKWFNSIRFAVWLFRQELSPEMWKLTVAAWLRKRGFFVAKLPAWPGHPCGLHVCYIEVYKAAHPDPPQKGKKNA